MADINIDKIIVALEQCDSPRSEFVKFMSKVNDPFKVLIGCILSLRTKDEVTFPASQRIFSLAGSPEDIVKLSEDEISVAIYPVGFYRNKAAQILQISHELITKYNSIVPDSIDELLKFRGVGRKTANLVLAKGYNIPAICVDIHVHRIFNRIGYVHTTKPDETELELRRILPEKYWLKVNDLLVTHGQNICKPIHPKCDICPIFDYCKRII